MDKRKAAKERRRIRLEITNLDSKINSLEDERQSLQAKCAECGHEWKAWDRWLMCQVCGAVRKTLRHEKGHGKTLISDERWRIWFRLSDLRKEIRELEIEDGRLAALGEGGSDGQAGDHPGTEPDTAEDQ